METIAVIGSSVTGVTSAYALAQRGYAVTLFGKHRYTAMETSFANSGQLFRIQRRGVEPSRPPFSKGCAGCSGRTRPCRQARAPVWPPSCHRLQRSFATSPTTNATPCATGRAGNCGASTCMRGRRGNTLTLTSKRAAFCTSTAAGPASNTRGMCPAAGTGGLERHAVTPAANARHRAHAGG